jgi:hypothetical protein
MESPVWDRGRRHDECLERVTAIRSDGVTLRGTFRIPIDAYVDRLLLLLVARKAAANCR